MTIKVELHGVIEWTEQLEKLNEAIMKANRSAVEEAAHELEYKMRFLPFRIPDAVISDD